MIGKSTRSSSSTSSIFSRGGECFRGGECSQYCSKLSCVSDSSHCIIWPRSSGRRKSIRFRETAAPSARAPRAL
eukprot:6186329-Pleurochrysis_carterae.AAC.5